MALPPPVVAVLVVIARAHFLSEHFLPEHFLSEYVLPHLIHRETP